MVSGWRKSDSLGEERLGLDLVVELLAEDDLVYGALFPMNASASALLLNFLNFALYRQLRRKGQRVKYHTLHIP